MCCNNNHNINNNSCRTNHCSHLKSTNNKDETIELTGESNLLLSHGDVVELPSIYFTDPQQLLEILHIMEEQNLYLIHNHQEMEQALDKQNHNMFELQKSMEAQTESLTMQIVQLESVINQERNRADELRQDMIALVRDSVSKQVGIYYHSMINGVCHSHIPACDSI